MQRRSVLHISNAWRAGLILMGFFAAVGAGASFLVHPSPYSPLALIGAVAAVTMGVASLRKPVWALYAALFVVLLPMGLIPEDVHSILNRSLTVIAFGTWLLDVVTQRRRVVWTSTTLLMLSFLTWGFVTLLWAENLSAAMTALQAYVLRLILYLFLVANEIRTKEDLNGLMNTLALSGWVLVLITAGTLLLEGYTPGTRLKVLSENENDAGVLALATMPGVLWLAMRTSGRRKTVSMLLSLVFVFLAFILTALSGSRGGAISFLITLFAFWLWKPTRPWGILALLILVSAAVSAPFIFSTTLERIAGAQGDTALGGREALWQATWLLIRDRPWQGVGIGNAPYSLIPYLGEFKDVWGFERVSVHNPVLAIWAETGIPGVLLYLGILGSAVWLFVRQYLRHRRAGWHNLMPYFAVVLSVFLGYVFSWIKGGGMEYGFTYFMMLALLVAPSCLEDTEALGNSIELEGQGAGRGKPGRVEAPGLWPGLPL